MVPVLQDSRCVVFVPLHQTRDDVGVSFILLIEITLPLTEKKIEATVETWTVSKSLAIVVKIGNCCSFRFHQANISNVANS